MNRISKPKYAVKVLVIMLLVVLRSQAQSSGKVDGKLVFSENFTKDLNKKHWIAEVEPTGTSSVYTNNSKLIVDTAGGVTVWFTQKLDGNIRVEYDWEVKVDSGRNDRLFDLNQFWMASDPKNKDIFYAIGEV